MDDIIPNSLKYLSENWSNALVGTGEAALMLGINFNTFSTRLKRDQALADRREPLGGTRASVSFTGFQLVHNLLADRLMRYGFSADLANDHVTWARDHILAGEQYTDAVLRFMKDMDGRVAFHRFEHGDVEAFTGDAAAIIPFGTMIVRLAVALYVRDTRDHRERISRGFAAGMAVDMREAMKGKQV